ncbi:hypothetical protein Tco_0673969 [Tanacetum coccineum]
MSSDSASSEVTYTSISSHGDPLAWAVDFFRLQEPDSPEAAPASPDYVPGPEEPEQAPLSPDYVPGPEYPEYLAPSDEEVPMEDQPYVVADSPIALSPGYVADSDLDEDPEENSEDGPASKEEEEHVAPANFVVAPVADHVPSSEETEPFETDESAATPPSPPACRTTARISILPEALILLPPEEEVERLLALPTPPPSPLISLSPPTAENACKFYVLATPARGIRWVGFQLAIPRPTGGRYGLIMGLSGTLMPKPDRQRGPMQSRQIGSRDTSVDRIETTEWRLQPLTPRGSPTLGELSLTTGSGADTQEIYVVIEDTQDRQTQIYQTVETLVDDSQYHYETARLLDQRPQSPERLGTLNGLSLRLTNYELQKYTGHTFGLMETP